MTEQNHAVETVTKHDHASLAAAKHAFDTKKQEHGNGAGVRHIFQRFAHATSVVVGTPWAFGVALLIVILWALSGKAFGFSDTWQLVINTGTTIVTFLMVFLIQSTQNRDAKAIHLKLDELIRAKRGARNAMVDLEHCTDEELEQIEQEFMRIRRRADRHGGHAHAHAPANADTHGVANPEIK